MIQANALIGSKAKINVFLKKIHVEGPLKGARNEENISKNVDFSL